MPSKKDQIVVLRTDLDPLVIRGNPTLKEVRGYVEEHHRRFTEGLPGGPDGSRARRIESATRYADEYSFLTGEAGKSIKIEDIIRA